MDSGQISTALENSPAASRAYDALVQAGATVHVVGGAVRDAALGKAPKDVDLLASGVDEDVIERALENLPGTVNVTGKQFGVYRYRFGQDEVEVALPRTEYSTGPAYTDFQVTADPYLPLESDLKRRDFTANAMAYNPQTGEVLDPYGGMQDIEDNKLSLVNDQAFQDDPLRILRAVVAYARHGLEPDENVLQEMSREADKIRHLPAERLQMELDKLMTSPDPTDAIRLAQETGVLDYILPEVSNAFGFNQNNPHHDLDVGNHSLAVLKAACQLTTDPDVRMAALLHDIGKPETYWEDAQGHGHFYETPDVPGSANHETVGADMAQQIMTRLRYPNDRINHVVKLIDAHMFKYFTNARGARRFLASLGGDQHMAWELLTLRQADATGHQDGTGLNEYDAEHLALARELLQKVIDDQNAFTVKDLAIGGRDLMKMGIKPGPIMGEILNDLLDRVVEDPALNDKAMLEQYVRDYIQERISSYR